MILYFLFRAMGPSGEDLCTTLTAQRIPFAQKQSILNYVRFNVYLCKIFRGLFQICITLNKPLSPKDRTTFFKGSASTRIINANTYLINCKPVFYAVKISTPLKLIANYMCKFPLTKREFKFVYSILHWNLVFSPKTAFPRSPRRICPW